MTVVLHATIVAAVCAEERFVENQDLSGSQAVVSVPRAWHVTDDGLKRLRSYVLRGEVDIYMQNKVRRLVLDGTQVTDRGLKHLEGKDGLLRLEDLSLANTRVTGNGLTSLAGLKHLRHVNLGTTFVFREGVSGVRVTTAGIRSLQTALPDCRISHKRVPLELSAQQSELFRLWSGIAEARLNSQGDIVALFVHRGTRL